MADSDGIKCVAQAVDGPWEGQDIKSSWVPKHGDVIKAQPPDGGTRWSEYEFSTADGKWHFLRVFPIEGQSSPEPSVSRPSESGELGLDQ